MRHGAFSWSWIWISAGYVFWNRCAVVELLSWNSCVLLAAGLYHAFLLKMVKVKPRDGRNSWIKSEDDVCESTCILWILLSPHIHPPRAARPARFIGLVDWMGWMLLSLYRLQIQVSSVIMNHQNWTGFRKLWADSTIFHHALIYQSWKKYEKHNSGLSPIWP